MYDYINIKNHNIKEHNIHQIFLKDLVIPRLYHKAKNLVDPFAYERYRQQRVQQKIEQARASRITVTSHWPPKILKTICKRFSTPDSLELILRIKSSKSMGF